MGLKLESFGLQAIKNVTILGSAMVFFSVKGWDKLLAVVPLLLLGYILTVPLKIIIEKQILGKTALSILNSEENDYKEFAKNETRTKVATMESNPLRMGKRIYLYLKRDMLLAIFSIIALPLAPQMFSIMQNIPVLHMLHPMDTQPMVAKRASTPYKMDDSATMDSTVHLLKQTAVPVIILSLAAIYLKLGNTVSGNNNPSTMFFIVSMGVFLVGTFYNALSYIKWTERRMVVALTITTKVVDKSGEEKEKGHLSMKMGNTMNRVRDGFKE